MDPALLGENLRRNRLERTKLRQAELRRAKLRETPGDATNDGDNGCEPGASMEDIAAATNGNLRADSWSQEFAVRQIQRRANQVRC